MENFNIEDILGNLEKNKKVNSSAKGKAGERSLSHIFNKRFSSILSKNPSWGGFYRSDGSGARCSQVSLSNYAKKIQSGDVVCENFKFTIESKIGYDIDLFSVFLGNKELDKFLSQAEKDSLRCGKKPMLVWKKSRKPRLAFIKDLEEHKELFNCTICYKGWFIVSLDELLEKLPDEFFFNLF